MSNNQDIEKIVNQSMTQELKDLVDEAFKAFENKTRNSGVGDADAIIQAKEKEMKKIISYIQKNGKLLEQDASARVRQRQKIAKAFDFTPERKKIEGEVLKVVNKAQDILYKDSGMSSSKKVDRTLISQDFLKKVFQENKVRVGTKYDKASDDNIYFDTETTGNDRGSDLAVTIGTYIKGQKSNQFIESKHTISNLMKAVAVTKKGSKELYDSAIQLRKHLGLKESGKVSKAEMEKAWTEYKKAHADRVTTLSQIVDMLENAQKENKKIVGYNTGFDIDVLKNLAQQNGETELLKRLSKLSVVDAREKAVSHTKILGDSQFLGTHQLQDMVKMLLGNVASEAHDAASDAEHTALVYNKLGSTNFLKVFSKSLEELATAKGVKKYKEGTKTYSDDYKKLARNLFDSMVDYKHGKKFGSTTTSMSESDIIGNEIQTSAQKQVAKLFKSLGDGSGKQTTAQKALSGQHLLDRAEKLGKNFTNITASGVGKDITDNTTEFAKGTSAYYLEQIISAANSKGWNVALQSDGKKVTLGLYPQGKYANEADVKLDEIATIDVGLVDNNGTIQMGGTANANIMYPTVNFESLGEVDGKEKWKVNNQIESANELQLKRILDGISGSGKIDAMLQQGEEADLSRLQGSLKFMRNQALSGVPTTASSAVMKEATSEMRGGKTPEQMAGITGMISVSELAKTLYGNKDFRDEINQMYDETIEEKWKKKTVNASDLSGAEIEAVNIAIAMIAEGWTSADSPHVANLQDGLVKRILTSDAASLFRKNIQGFVDNGIAPTFESLKEESFIAGHFSISGSHDILPFNSFGDFSNRALNQVFNRNRRAKASTMGRENLFTSEVGRNLGVNYSGEEMKQYVGATTTDEKFFKALQSVMEKQEKSTDEINKILTSVKEGGMIIPKSMADDLMSYRERNSQETMAEDIDDFFLAHYGLNKENLSNLKSGEILSIDKIADKKGDFSGHFSVDVNDMLIGIKKTEHGYQLITEKLEEVTEGSKLLTDVGGRQTARILDDKIFKAVTDELKVSGANFLTEEKGLSSKTLMESLRGRISYIITQALERQDGKSREDKLKKIEDALKAMPIIGKAIERVGDKFQVNAFYDRETKGYKYIGEDGSEYELFSNADDVRKALIEGQGSAIESLGKALLDGTYESTKGLIATSVNMAKEVPYFEVIGGGTAEVVESEGRVKYARREREAFSRAMDRFSSAEGMDTEGLALYTKVETDLQNRFGPVGEQAQKDIAKLEDVVGKRNGSNIKGKTIELVWGTPTKENQIDISDAIDRFEYNEGEGIGISEEDYNSSVGGKIASFLKNNQGFENAEVVLNMASAGVELADNANKLLRVANIQGSVMQDGSYMPSVTDLGLTHIVSSVNEKANIDEAIDTMYKDFHKAATDKDSALVRKATESYMANSSYVKVVGQNDAAVKLRGLQAENTMAVNSEHLKELLSTQVSAKTTSMDYAKNLQNLSRMLSVIGQGSINEVYGKKLEDFDDIEKWAEEKTIYLAKFEEKLVNLLLEQVKNGKSLVTQFHRYPSTSGMDIRHGYLTVDDSLEKGTMAIARGSSLMVNADYDGDKMWLRPVLAQAENLTHEEYIRAYGAISQVAGIESKIAQEMAEWERNQDKEKYEAFKKEPENAGLTEDQLKQAFEAKKRKKQEDALIDDIYGKDGEGRENNRLAAIMSKANKKYVGQFSNASTYFRRNKTLMGMDSVGGEGGQQLPVYSALLSAFTEVLEQDSISAKKVFQRLSGEKGEDVAVAIDELDALYKLLSDGEFEKAIDKAMQLGIMGDIETGMIDTRQFKLAQATLKHTDAEAYAASGLESGVSDKLLKQAVRVVEGRAKEYDMTLQDMFSRNEDMVKGKVANYRGSTSKAEDAKREEKIATPAKYTPASKVGELDEKVHVRPVYDQNNKAYAQATTLTTVLHKGEPEMAKWEKEKADRVAALGTYAHKLMELMVADNVTSVDELDAETMPEAEKALNQLKDALGNDATPALFERMQRRASNLARFARKQNLISENAEAEVTLGGKIDGMDEAISGQADLFTFDENGAAIADWKFSGKGGIGDEKTIGERIVQSSFYLRQYEADLSKRIEDINKKIQDGTATDNDKAELENATQKLEAIRKNATIKIARSFEKNGQEYIEILEAKALDADFVFDQIKNKAAGGHLDMDQILGASEYSITSYDANTGARVINPNQTKEMKAAQKVLDEDVKSYKKILALQNDIYKLELEKENANEARQKVLDAEINKLKNELKLEEEIRDKNQKDLVNQIQYIDKAMEEDYNIQMNQVTQEGAYDKAIIDAKHQEKISSMDSKKGNQAIKEYEQALKKQNSYERDIARLRKDMEGQSGDELRTSQAHLDILQKQYNKYAEILAGYDRANGTLHGIKLTQEQIAILEKKISDEQGNHAVKMSTITNQYSRQQGLLSQIMGGFKTAFRNITDASLAYSIINQVKSGINQVIQATKELDKSLVDIQIATGQTRSTTRELLIEYNDLADEMGRTTQSVAVASNDWLRAGYEGKEAAELTRASMMLSTLGMIEASEATTYLISTLKGWKIEANEVIGVVDKLTAVDMQAAISAGDLALAMSRANASARIAGSDMNNFIGYVTTIADRTQKSAESVGESMKTLYARYGNVKVNKFSASQAEMESSNYNEDEYESLNDLETVLTSLGIKLRENAQEWRDFDTVIQDIAEHWDNWDLTTKNAVSTAFAGTRQRENFLTLMDSWDDVDKYVEIASDSYGTATSKMEAYTDSVEAAQQRVQAAIEAWALWADGAGAIKDFYNALAYGIENIHIFGAALLALGLMLKGDSIKDALTTGIAKIGTKFTDFSMIFAKAGILGENKQYLAKERSKRIQDYKEEDWRFAQKQMFQPNFDKAKKTYNLTESQATGLADMQDYMLRLSRDEKLKLANNLYGNSELLFGDGFSDIKYDDKLLKWTSILNTSMEEEEAKNLATALLTRGIEDLDGVNKEEIKNGLEKIRAGKRNELTQEELNAANAYLARARRDAANGEIADEARRSAEIGDYKIATVKGVAMSAGTIAGTYGFSNVLGDILSDKKLLGQDLGPVGEILGGTLGASIGAYASETLISGITSAMAGNGFLAAITNPWTAIPAIIITGLMAGVTIWKKHQKKLLQEAQEAFKEAEEKYSAAKGSNITAQEYDKLAKGVDSLGRNVSLTDEEYQDFLNKSNELAELFPELIVRTDEEGNKLVGLGNIVGGVADEVANLNEELRHFSDEALLNDKVFDNAFDETYEKIRQEELKINNLRKGTASVQDYKNIYDKYGIGYTEKFDIQTNSNQIRVNEEDISRVSSVIEMAIQEYEKEVDNLMGTMEDYIQAESRELQYNNENFKNELKEMSDEAKKIYDDMISDIDLRKKDINGNFEKNFWTGDYIRKSDEEVQQEIQDIVDFINSSFDNIGTENIEIAFKAPEDYETLGQIDEARKQLLTSLINAFGDEFDEKELKILVALGFEVDEDGDVIDNNNRFKQIKKQFASARGKASFWLPNDEDEFLRNLSTNDIDSLQDLLESNSINKNTSLDTISKWLLQESPITNNLRGKTDFYGRMVGQTQSFNADMTAFLNENSATLINAKIWDSNEVDALIDEYFSDYRANVRGQIKNVAKEFKGANSEELAEAQARMFSLGGSMTISNEIEAQMNMAKQAVSDAFDDISDFGDDGLINTFEELKTVVDDLASSMERLKEARKEDTTQGKLSVATVLDLINTDKNYINALQVVDGKIRLKADAENIVAQAQVNAMKASIQAQIATDMETVAKLKSELASLSAGEATAEEISTENSHIQALGEEVKAIDAATNAERRRTAAKIAGAMADAGNLSGAQSWYAKSQGTANDVTTSFSAGTVEVPVVMSPEEQQARMEEIGKQLKELTGNDYLKWDEKGEYLMYDPEDRTIDAETGYYSGGSIGIMQHLQEGITVEDLYSGKYAYDGDGGKTPLEKLQELESAINKEWEAMMAKKEGRYTEYFKKMRNVLLQEEAMIKGMLASVPEGSAEYLDYQKQLQEVQVKINNLDDEELEDKMKNLETIESTIAAQIAVQRELIKVADTEEEKIERQKELNELLKEEQELRRDIRDYQRELIETELEYESGTPDSDRYKELIKQQEELYEQDMTQARLAIQDARNEAYQRFRASHTDDYGNQTMTDSELWYLANNSEEVQEAVKNYIEAFQSAAELAMQVVEDKISALDKELEVLENARPNEWVKTSDIDEFYKDKIDLLQDKIDIWEEALKDTNNLTDEQITELVESINDATKELQEAKIAKLEDIKEHDDKYYEAVVWQVNQYIEEIELAKKANDDWYDDAIKKLQDYNDDLDRTNKLLELQNKLKAASQEKERVNGYALYKDSYISQ